MPTPGPLLRIFEVRAKNGCADELMAKFATVSADVVQGEPGNQGCFFGRCVQGDDNVLMFVSVWEDLNAVKARFGAEWRSSYMPEGYEELIEECSVRHFDMSSGWSLR